MTRIEIDPNVRVRGNQTYSGYEDVTGDLVLHDMVEVYESEAGIVGTAEVTEIDAERKLVYLAVDWSSIHAGEETEPALSSDAPAVIQGVWTVRDRKSVV